MTTKDFGDERPERRCVPRDTVWQDRHEWGSSSGCEHSAYPFGIASRWTQRLRPKSGRSCCGRSKLCPSPNPLRYFVTDFSALTPVTDGSDPAFICAAPGVSNDRSQSHSPSPSRDQPVAMAGATGPWDACWKPFRVYRQLSSPARIGFEACGNTQWFEDMLDRLGHEVWMGDAAKIRASYVRKQKTDRRDAAHILSPLPECRPACGDGRTGCNT